MIYQKKSPKTVLFIRATNENYDFVCRLAGELSLSAFLNKLLDEMRESDSTFCIAHTNSKTIGADSYVR